MRILRFWVQCIGLGLTWQTSDGYDQQALANLFARARHRIAADRLQDGGGGEPHVCSLDQRDARPNIFLFWRGSADEFGQQAFSVLETVLYQHPAANVAVFSLGLAADMFDVYMQEGYCVASATLDYGEILAVLSTAVPDAPAKQFLEAREWADGEAVFTFLLNCLAMGLQILYGGVTLMMDGLLLNPFDIMLPQSLSLIESVVVLEQVLGPGARAPPSYGVLQGEDFDHSWLPRSFADRSDGRTVLCLDLSCPRHVPADSNYGRSLLQSWLELYMSRPSGSREVPDLSELATGAYRLYLTKRPQRTPFEVEGFLFNHEVVVLPYWAIVEAHAQDGWKAFGSQADVHTEHTQLFSQRAGKEASDWSLLSTSKLWLPLGYGPMHARNIMPRSFMDMALRFFTLGVSQQAYRPKAFGRRAKGPWTRGLTSPRDPQKLFLGLDGMSAKPEAALPGEMGAFRSLRHVRLVGIDRDASAAGGGRAVHGHWQVTVQATDPSMAFFCRKESRPFSSREMNVAAMKREGSAYRDCKSALVHAQGSTGMVVSENFRIMGSPARVNAALSLLAYRPKPGLGARLAVQDQAAATVPSSDIRLSTDKLLNHFAEIRIQAAPVQKILRDMEVTLLALLDDVEEQITVVAHCAERCWLLDRLAQSFREVYRSMQIIVTCECHEHEICDVVTQPHKTIPQMTVVQVPYDYGLSRGKALLAKLVETEFTLVLDDDFVLSYHSCLECMLWRMHSPTHSFWRPFDILGFPVQEDERGFGAFRGKLRVIQHQLFLEPFVSMELPDGCVRLDICPMVFLARTARLRLFEFQSDLQVGEHEQFFYLNSYQGMQVAVCFDSSFPHFRVQTQTESYMKRRERMPALMASSFRKLGFQRAMYMFRKYSHGSMIDYDELLDRSTPPWYVSDDTCGPGPSPPVPFAQLFVVVLSTCDESGARYRHALRGETGGRGIGGTAADAWLQQLSEATDRQVQWVFATTIHETMSSPLRTLAEEQSKHGDIIMVPAKQARSAAGSLQGEAGIETLLHVFATLRDFQFRWLLVLQQDVFVPIGNLIKALAENDHPPHRVAMGAWTQVADDANSPMWLDPRFVAMSRDVFFLLSSPELMPMLGGDAGHDIAQLQSGTDLSSLGGGLNAWFRAFAVHRVPFNDLYTLTV